MKDEVHENTGLKSISAGYEESHFHCAIRGLATRSMTGTKRRNYDTETPVQVFSSPSLLFVE